MHTLLDDIGGATFRLEGDDYYSIDNLLFQWSCPECLGTTVLYLHGLRPAKRSFVKCFHCGHCATLAFSLEPQIVGDEDGE